MNHRQRMRERFGAANSSKAKTFSDNQPPPSIELRIDRLVLAGIPAVERFGVVDATNRELTRILAEQGLPSTLRDLPSHERLDGGDIALERSASAATTGQLIARAVYRGMRNAESGAVPTPMAFSSEPGTKTKS